MTDERNPDPLESPAQGEAEAVHEEAARISAAGEQESTEGILDELAKLKASVEDVEVGGIEELEAIAEREEAGVWSPWPVIAGARVLVAHLSAASDRQQELDAAYRKRFKIAPGVELQKNVREAIFRESFFGTVVRDWSGMRLSRTSPDELPFNLANYRRLVKLRQFRGWVFVQATDQERFRVESAEALRGN